MNDPRSDEHRFPEGDMNANPTRPFVVATDLSHYVVRETATGKSLTKRCTFDEADHACNLLNYGWRACAKQATEEMNSQKESEARERALYLKQIAELKATQDEDCCSNCGRRCCNRLCERCKIADMDARTGTTEDERRAM